MTDLGALPVNSKSAAGSINARGWITGQSQSDQLDPVLGIPEFRGVLWKQGQVSDLGTLGTGTESLGIYVNDAGEVVGFSTTSTASDPLGFFGFPTHTFIWRNGQVLDIGTLGGADSLPGQFQQSADRRSLAGRQTQGIRRSLHLSGGTEL
jgi:probable HAF family extracellular repeat protein